MSEGQAHIQQIIDGRLQELNGKLAQSKAFQHKGEKGSVRETFLLDYLQSELNDVASVIGSSEIIDTAGQVSKQVDITVLSHGARPLLELDYALVPIESVLASIEVKSHLDTKELKASCENFASIAGLKRTAYATRSKPRFNIQGTEVEDWPTLGVIFAYDGIDLGKLFDEFYKWCAGRNAHERPHSIWVLNQGFITWGDTPSPAGRGRLTAPPILEGLRLVAERAPSNANVAAMMAMILHDTFAGVRLPAFNLRDYYMKGVFSYGETTSTYYSSPVDLKQFTPEPVRIHAKAYKAQRPASLG